MSRSTFAWLWAVLARRDLLLLAVIPIGLLCLATALREIRGPYYLGANSDPDYAYLFNSLNVLSLQAPDMIEHPGTTAQTLGAVAIVARWLPSLLTTGPTSVQDAVLKDPEIYLAAISVLLVALVSSATFIVGFVAFRAWGRLLPAVMIQLTLLLFTQVSTALPKVSPEPLLIACALILIAMLIPLVSDTQVARQNGFALPIWIGATMGFGVATKFTFLPLLAFVFLIPGWSRKGSALIAAALAFGVFTLPVAVNYKWMLEWLKTLASHKGVNGSGETGLPDLSTVQTNLNFLTAVASPLFVLLALYSSAVLVLSLWSFGLPRSTVGRVRNLLLITCVVIAAQIAVTLKNVGAHYLLPSMVMCGLANAAIVLLLMRAAPQGWPELVGRFAAATAILVGVFTAGTSLARQAGEMSAYAQGTRNIEEQVQRREATVVSYYRSSLPVYALAFGNDFVKDRYNDRLHALYPDALFYSIWLGKFYTFAGDAPDDEVTTRLASGEVVLYGSPFVGDYVAYRKPLVIEPILSGPTEAAYRLVRIDRQGAGPP